MVDQNLLTLFLAVTAVAVLIQTGMIVGFLLISAKLTRHVDQTLELVGKSVGPLHATTENLQTVSANIAELTSKLPEVLRKLEPWIRHAA